MEIERVWGLGFRGPRVTGELLAVEGQGFRVLGLYKGGYIDTCWVWAAFRDPQVTSWVGNLRRTGCSRVVVSVLRG